MRQGRNSRDTARVIETYSNKGHPVVHHTVVKHSYVINKQTVVYDSKWIVIIEYTKQ